MTKFERILDHRLTDLFIGLFLLLYCMCRCLIMGEDFWYSSCCFVSGGLLVSYIYRLDEYKKSLGDKNGCK